MKAHIEMKMFAQSTRANGEGSSRLKATQSGSSVWPHFMVPLGLREDGQYLHTPVTFPISLVPSILSDS